MKKINRASDSMGIKGTIPIKRETLHPNKNYTVEEQVLLHYLLSLPPEWNLKQDWVIKKYDGIMGRDRIKKAWSNLKLKGHLMKNRGEKFTDVYWMVYELPPKDWNSVHPLVVNQESVNNNTHIQDTDIKETDITSAYTGTNTLGKNNLLEKPIPEHLKCTTSTLGEYSRKNMEQYSMQLINATVIGADIFNYDTDYKMKSLQKRIGTIKYEQVKPTLMKWIEAKNLLNR